MDYRGITWIRTSYHRIRDCLEMLLNIIEYRGLSWISASYHRVRDYSIILLSQVSELPETARCCSDRVLYGGGGGGARPGVWPELTRHPFRHLRPDTLARTCCMDCTNLMWPYTPGLTALVHRGPQRRYPQLGPGPYTPRAFRCLPNSQPQAQGVSSR